MTTLRPSTKPVSPSPLRKAGNGGYDPPGEAGLTNPITGIVACGHATAPPSAAISSRRPIVTGMRPSRARAPLLKEQYHTASVRSLRFEALGNRVNVPAVSIGRWVEMRPSSLKELSETVLQRETRAPPWPILKS